MAFGKSALILVAALLPLAPLAMNEEAPPQGGLKTPTDWTWPWRCCAISGSPSRSVRCRLSSSAPG